MYTELNLYIRVHEMYNVLNFIHFRLTKIRMGRTCTGATSVGRNTIRNRA